MVTGFCKFLVYAMTMVSLVYCTGYIAQGAYNWYGGIVDRREMSIQTIHHEVVPGDTLYGIASKYYYKNEARINFAEFLYDVQRANPSINQRFLQTGDVVTVNYYVATTKQQ